MNSNLKLEKEGFVIFEKPIDKARNGIAFFLAMYKKIESNENTIIIKGLKDAGYLPLKVPISREIVELGIPIQTI